jgi:hypothetical protein
VPIRPYLHNRVFGPQLVKAMGEAFEMACRALALTPSTEDRLTARVAEAVIAAAKSGASDAESLFENAMLSLGIEADGSPPTPQKIN